MKKRNKFRKKLTFTLGLFFILSGFNTIRAADDTNEAFNPGDMVTHHVVDAHIWHLWEGHYGTIYLPVILYSDDRGLESFSSDNFFDEHHESVPYMGYRIENSHIIPLDPERHIVDFSITKNVASMFLSVIILFLVFFSVRKGYIKNEGKAPRGIQSFFEPIIIFIRDEVAKPNIGDKYEKFLPYLLTIFFFIWFNNLMGLLPGSANVTGNLAVTGTLAIFTFIITQINGSKNYWRHIFNTPGVPWWLKVPLPIMPVVELMGVFTKPFSLTVRLFANIIAGHIIILSILSLIFIFGSIWIGPLTVAFAIFMYFLELFVAILQAFIFTILSAMYFGMAVEEHH